ncbi:MAG: VanZ family protein [Planctomycetota bacterium]
MLSKRWLWAFVALGLMALIFWASSRSWTTSHGVQRQPGRIANLLHFLFYGILTASWGLALGTGFGSSIPKYWKRWGAALAVSSLFGLFDEWHQDSVAGRTCSLFDAIENLLGGVFGVAATSWSLSARGLSRARLRVLALIAIWGVVVGLFAAQQYPHLDAILSRLNPSK